MRRNSRGSIKCSPLYGGEPPLNSGVRWHMKNSLVRILAAASLIGLAPLSCAADDLFVGAFESENRANFGSDSPGEYRIQVVALSPGKYEAKVFRRGALLGTKSLIACPAAKDDYLRSRPPGRAESLCTDDYGVLNGFLSYSENGIVVPAVKQKYVDSPDLVKKEGLKPGAPELFEPRHHAAKYYGHVSWFVYGFRKVEK